MYLTAQRVEGRAGEGINAYRHETVLSLPVDWEAVDQGELSLESPSRRLVELPPGGNSVLSYLDVVGGDAVTSRALGRLIRWGASEESDRTWTWEGSEFCARMCLCVGVAHSPRPERELEALLLRVKRLLQPSAAPEPLEVTRLTVAEGLMFELHAGAARRLRVLHGDAWQPARVLIRTETFERWRALGLADLESEIVATLTGLGLEQLEEQGGVLVRSPPSGAPAGS